MGLSPVFLYPIMITNSHMFLDPWCEGGVCGWWTCLILVFCCVMRRFPAHPKASALLQSPLPTTGLDVPMDCVHWNLVLGQKRDTRMTTNEMSIIPEEDQSGQRNEACVWCMKLGRTHFGKEHPKADTKLFSIFQSQESHPCFQLATLGWAGNYSSSALLWHGDVPESSGFYFAFLIPTNIYPILKQRSIKTPNQS